MKYNASVVSCNLGNPVTRGKIITSTLRFDSKNTEDSEPEISFTVFANSTSKQLEPQDDIVLKTKIIKRAELSVYG